MAEPSPWAGDMGRVWARLHEATDRQFADIHVVAMAALDARPGERVLDLGCGAGTTTRAIAEAVGPQGRVTGVDISPDLVAVAQARLAGLPAAEALVADAATHPFAPGTCDALFSRHGCMFFPEPAVAFANIRRGLRPGARAVMSCFTTLAENPWAAVPLAAVNALIGPAVPDATPGPFAWGDPATFRGPLAEAGFRHVSWEPVALTMTLGAGDDPDPVERGALMAASIGAVARRLSLLDEATRARVRPALAAALAPYVRDGWVRLPGRIWIVRAVA